MHARSERTERQTDRQTNGRTYIMAVARDSFWQTHRALFTIVLLYISAKDETSCCGDSNVKIFSNGDCVWYQPFYLSISQCPIDITWFPFDAQKCNLTYESISHESQELNITVKSPAVVLDSYTSNGEWNLHGTWSWMFYSSQTPYNYY